MTDVIKDLKFDMATESDSASIPQPVANVL